METVLNRITGYLLTQSWQIALLVTIIASVNIILRNKSAHVRYLLWLIVLAKCLVPPLYNIPLAILPEENSVEPVLTSLPAVKLAVDSEVADTALTEAPALTSVPFEMSPLTVAGEGLSKMTVRQRLGLVWLLGASAFMLFNLLKALRAHYWLWRRRKLLPAGLRNDIENLFSAHGIKSLPGIWLVDGFSQPFVWGLLRGSIYLPFDFLNINKPQHQRSVLGHEINHIVRFDAAVNFLQVIAQAIFWFHPFVWWVNRKIRAEREKCCDEMAIARLNTLPRDYSTAIVETLAARNKSIRPVPSLAVAGKAKNIEERIRTMLKPGKKFYKRPSLIAATFVFLLALLTAPTAVVLTARAEMENTAESKEGANRLGQLEYFDHLSSDEYLARCTSVAISPDGRHLYATAYGSRCLVIFGRDQATGYIKRLKKIPLKGAFTTRVSPDGRYVVCSDVKGRSEYYAGSNSVSLFERDQSTGNVALLDSIKNGDHAIDNLDYVVDADFSPDSQFAYVVARNSAAVTTFRITDDKKLAFVQSTKGQDKCFDGARGIAVSPDGEYIYVASTQVDTLTVLKRNAESGEVSLKQVIKNEQGGIYGLQGIWDVTCSPDGVFVYTNAQGKHDAVCAFKRIVDGTLSLVQQINGNEGQVGLDGGTRLRVSPDGQHLYALGGSSDSIVTFQRHRKTGKLTYLQTHSFRRIGKYCFPADLGISPDGTYVYVGGESISLNGIVLLRRLTGTTIGPADALYKAACTGDSKRLQSLIEGGADINVRGERGYTALHWAAKENNKKAAELLLAAEADVNVRTSENGWTPLHVSVMQSNKDVAELLIAKGADPDAENGNNGLTPLLVTQKTGDMDFAEFIVDKGAIVGIKGEGTTPLHYAAKAGDITFMDLLIRKGADIDPVIENGWTPLFFAIRMGEKDAVEWLVSKGAGLNVKDHWDLTPLGLANTMNRTEIVELLKRHGAKE
ncbi:MAG TPA: hypothetical protein DIU00_03460 [Phycisphaerales bacterium]|nr:hypothetical protein [Phycisphaerales bacterium]